MSRRVLGWQATRLAAKRLSQNNLVKHIPTESNPADMFTKVLTRQVFERHARFVMNWAADERPPDERIAQDKNETKKT